LIRPLLVIAEFPVEKRLALSETVMFRFCDETSESDEPLGVDPLAVTVDVPVPLETKKFGEAEV
jgi:hypothetical protein